MQAAAIAGVCWPKTNGCKRLKEAATEKSTMLFHLLPLDWKIIFYAQTVLNERKETSYSSDNGKFMDFIHDMTGLVMNKKFSRFEMTSI